jgi:hypothetical protein
VGINGAEVVWHLGKVCEGSGGNFRGYLRIIRRVVLRHDPQAARNITQLRPPGGNRKKKAQLRPELHLSCLC